MTNKIGVTFREGVWYNCNKENYFFKYEGDYMPKTRSAGILYKEWICSSRYETREAYINNTDYLDRATEAKEEEIQPFLPYPFKQIENLGYQIY